MGTKVITLPDRIRPFPIPDNEILGAAVPVSLLLELQAQIDELQAERMGLAVLVEYSWKLVRELTAVCAALTNDAAHRQFLLQSHRRAEREASKLQLPLWFWRPERARRDPDDVQPMLNARAQFLAGERKASLDDAFDLLTEFCQDWLRLDVPDLISNALRAAYAGKGD